jgi:hypothetical protein
MDPISAIKHVVAGIQVVMQIRSEMQANQAECRRLIDRVGGFAAPFERLLRQKEGEAAQSSMTATATTTTTTTTAVNRGLLTLIPGT